MLKTTRTGLLLSGIIALALAFTACSHDSKKKLFPFGDTSAITNDSGGNVGTPEDTTQGISGNENITVVNGKILVKVDSGVITIAGENLILTVQQNGTWVLSPGVAITLTNIQGQTVSGTIVVDPTTGNISFVPTSALNVNELYTIHVTVGGTTYTASVAIAVDNTSQTDSLFADVTLHSTGGTFPVTSTIVNARALLGWQFPPNFKIQMIDVESGAKVYLTFFGVYDVAAYQDLVFYQRWADGHPLANQPVKDYLWSTSYDSILHCYATGWITVDDQDSSIDGDVDYSFKRTYAEIRIVNSSGQDITATTNAKFKILAL